MRLDAIVRNFEIIGEASVKAPQGIMGHSAGLGERVAAGAAKVPTKSSYE